MFERGICQVKVNSFHQHVGTDYCTEITIFYDSGIVAGVPARLLRMRTDPSTNVSPIERKE